MKRVFIAFVCVFCDRGGSALSRCNLDVCAGVALLTFSHAGSESGDAEGRRLDAGT